MNKRKLLLGLLMAILVLAFFGCVETPKLLAPANLTISSDGLISWDAVDNADGYRITIGDNSYTVAVTQFQAPDTSSDFNFTVVAIAKGADDSEPSSGSYTAPRKPASGVPEDAVLAARVPSITINDDEFDDFDFTTMFMLSTDTQVYDIKSEYIDMSHVDKTDGGYVICAVDDHQAKIDVKIHVKIYHLTKSVLSVNVYVDEALNHDYSQYFRATNDGIAERITSSMTTSTVAKAAGQYSYGVSYHGLTQSIIVNVIDRVVISAGVKSVTLNDYELADYDFASLFSMTVNGARVKVTPELVDSSNVSTTRGGEVTCSKGEASAAISVIVIRNVYEVSLSKQELTLHTSLASDYDYLRFFQATHNGKTVDMSEVTITNNVKAVSGDYAFTVTLRDASATLTVHVTDVHQVQVVINYPNLELSVDNSATFDYTRLFTVYVDEMVAQVKSSMVDASSLTDAVAGRSYDVTLNFVDADDRPTTQTAKVKVVDNPVVTISSRNVLTYPNASPVELTSLFTIDEGGLNVPVTDQMLSGSVDYSKSGDNVITCSYGGASAQATVTVKLGVVIGTRADVIEIRKGTDKETYFFEDDFELIVNGVKIPDIFPFLDVSSVDFATVGEYTATLRVGYFDGKCTVPATPTPTAAMQYFTAEIVYKVTERVATVSLQSDSITLKLGDSFNPLSNVKATVNGAKQTLVTDRALVNALCCYVEIEQNADLSKVGTQPVKIKVYANGLNSAPQTVEFTVTVVSSAKITSYDKIVFEGDTLYATDLFAITDGDSVVPVTFDMLSGDVNVFKAGLYYVTLYYQGATSTARVAVLEQSVKGVYNTYATTIATESEEDSEGWTTVEGESSRPYGPMTFDESGIVVDGMATTVTEIIDEHTFIVKVGTSTYTMYMFDGIVVLDPDNSLKMSFTNSRRPLMYFNTSVWTLSDKGRLIVNYGEQHVLATSYTSYSIEVYTVTSKADNSVRQIALYVQLVSYMNSDTLYRVTWGDLTLNEGFVQQGGETGVLNYDSVTYSFTMKNSVVGKVNRDDNVQPLYTGTFRCGNDRLTLSSNGGVTYSPSNGDASVTVSKIALSNMKNGGIDYVNDTVFIYSVDVESGAMWYCYKFVLNREAKTFTLAPKDSLYGLYKYGSAYVFLDGYGGGLVSYNTSGHVTLQLKYAFNEDNRELAITHFNNYAYPQYGSGATFYLLDTLNVLIVKQMYDSSLVGRQFVNAHISDGAIVRFNSVKLCEVSRTEVLNCLSITTKDGELTVEQMKNKVVIYDSIDRYQSGVYQIVVNVSVNGQTVKCYYAVQTFLPQSNVPDYAQAYASSVIMGSACSLSMDKYGLAEVTYNGESYVGNVSYVSDKRFVVRAKGASGANVTLVGEVIADGVIYASCTGALNFFDYFTLGENSLVGNGEKYLRKISLSGVELYVWSNNIASTGSIAQVELLPDHKLAVTVDGQTVVVNVTEWGNATSGMQISDNLRGQYAYGDNSTLVLDGFGGATIGGVNGSYTLNADGSVTIQTSNDIAVYALDRKNSTCSKVDIAFDNTLVAGKTFNASHTFVCQDYPYVASTTFTFYANGSVSIASTSAEHDLGEEPCSDDVYAPPYVENKLQNGSYSVSGNRVTVNVSNSNGSFTFVFYIVDVTLSDTIRCEQTDVDSDAHGYFKVGTTFVGFTLA